MPAVTHFAHHVVPRDKFDLTIVDGLDASLNLQSPGGIDILVAFRVKAVDQRRREFRAIRVRQSQGRFKKLLRF